MTKTAQFTEEVPREVRFALKALADDTRLALVVALMKHGEMSFSDLRKRLDLSPNALNFHLKELMKAALIRNTFLKQPSREFSFYSATRLAENLFLSLLKPFETETIAWPTTRTPSETFADFWTISASRTALLEQDLLAYLHRDTQSVGLTRRPPQPATPTRNEKLPEIAPIAGR